MKDIIPAFISCLVALGLGAVMGISIGRFEIRTEAIKYNHAHWEINTNNLPRVEAVFTWNTNR